ncbi:MAG: hypothetical protein ACI4F9_00940 [Lachnospiraceae bacterium]
MGDKVGAVKLELLLDIEKMTSSMNKACEDVRKKIKASFDDAGKSATKAVETSNEEIKAILSDAEKTAKSKAASIAAIYRKEGDSATDAMKKAWSHIERNSASETSKVKKHIKKISDSSKETALSMKKDFNGSFNAITSLAKKAAGAIATAFAVGKIVDFSKECVNLGSDLSEVQNVVDVTFTQMREQVNQFAQSAAKNFGLSETMAKRYTGTLGAMAKAFGFTEQEAVTMSMTLAGLAGDVASFYNISQDEAFTKLKSVFTGETESLKELGIVMTQSALDTFALSQGISKTTSDMTESEKVALRYKFVLQQLNTTSGDFARTSDGWANQMRILNLQFDSFKANIGQGLINVLTPAIKAINTLMEKLVQLSAKFKEFTELITGKSSNSSGTGSTISELAGIKGATDDIKDSAKEAKKEIRSLMGFDQINKLSDKEEESDVKIDIGSGLGNAAGQADKTESAIDRLKNKLKSLFDLFKEGFDLGFANADLENLLNQAKRVRDALESIFTDSRVVTAASNLGKQIVRTLGAITGSIARVAIEWGSAILGGIADSLETNKEKIAEKLSSILDNCNRFFYDLGELFLTLGDIFTTPEALENLRQLSADITTILIELKLTALDIITGLGVDLMELIITPIIDNKERLGEALGNTLGVISSVVGTVKDFIVGFCEKITELYDEHIKPFIDSLKEGFSEIFGTLLDTYNKYIVPVLDKLSGKIKDVVENNVMPTMHSMLELIGSFIDCIKELWQNWLQPLINWIAEKIVPILAPILDVIANTFFAKITLMCDALKILFDFAKGIIDFFKNIFALDIKGAFESVAQAAKDVFGGIVKTIKDAVNSAVDIINAFIDGINMVDVPDNIPVLGGIGNIPRIPHLAEGAYVKANTPRLAVIGDNKRYGEIVAPEDKLLEMAKMAASLSGGGSDAELILVLKEILNLLKTHEIVEINPEALRKWFIKKTNQNTMATGNSELII